MRDVVRTSLRRCFFHRAPGYRCLGFLLTGLSLFSIASSATAQDPFAANIRPTDPLTPDEERLALQVPDGFEVQLVAAEPDIQKPMNMAFDARGRIWITDTREYPLPLPVGEAGRDTIKILEDQDGDGRADKITTFADGLNIPIGLYPVGNGCVVFSIPHIWWLEDTDGDDIADQRTRLYGPFGFERDTHGLNNSFRRGFDGWLYACHGFNNQTTVAGLDGHEVSMQSGNTYRMRLDGRRIEQFTWGQVNPFGMTFDAWGNLFTADCHSKPIYQLLRGGYYPSFGKPHDGLGFVTPMMDHMHGSTAIAGLACYEAHAFPEAYRRNFFSGNVMTSRVNRDSVEYHGSTPQAIEEDDFVISRDPWFRPVDVQLGPDGALYVADFYNRIIGHYEVDLHHPGRDRTSGRLWRIVYRDSSGQVTSPSLASCDLSKLDLEQRIRALGDENLTRRLLALNLIVDDVTAESKRSVVAGLLTALNQPRNADQRIAAMWALWRLDAPVESLLVEGLNDPSAMVRVHAARILVEQADWNAAVSAATTAKLVDDDPLVRRTAAEGLALHPSPDTLAPLMQQLENSLSKQNERDPHEVYMLRRAVKNHLLLQGVYASLASDAPVISSEGRRLIDEISLAVPTEAAARYLLQRMESGQLSERADPVSASEHIARYCGATDVAKLARVAKQRFEANWNVQVNLIRSIREALATKQVDEPTELTQWGTELALSIWTATDRNLVDWANYPIVGKSRRDNPWVLQRRASADGKQDNLFLDSLPSGEAATGRLRSKVFEIPERFSFYCAGHLGHPDEPLIVQNFVRLIDARTGRVLKEAQPPRNDIAQRIEWDLADYAGQPGQLEIIDGDERGSFAWLAVGRFDPPVIDVPSVAPHESADQLQQSLALIQWNSLSGDQAQGLEKALAKWLLSANVDPALQAAIARSLIVKQADSRKLALASVIAEPSTSDAQRQQLAQAIAVAAEGSFDEALEKLFPALSSQGQRQFLRQLAASSSGRDTLASLIDRNQISPRLWSDTALREAIRAANDAELFQRLESVLAKLPAAADDRQQTVDARIRFITEHQGDASAGAELFQQHCAKCHKLGDRGEEVGPQLDGIALRGLVRVVEDVLDPNRNVDAAFRSTTVLTLDGRVLVGLFRRADGAALVFVDREGKEFRIPQADVDEQSLSSSSLMPDDVALELPPEKFADLISFLMEQQQTLSDASSN